jgi:DNA-binding CsgD family transcriptional regulator
MPSRARVEPAPRLPRLVGRARELAALRGALDGPAAVLLVEGEAGVGKSRLVHELLNGLDADERRRVLVAGCPPFTRPHTFGALTDALRQAVNSVAGLELSPLAGALRPLFPEWSATLPQAPEPAEDASVIRHRLFAAVAELLTAMRIRLLVVEDAHWADEATVEFLLQLAGGRPRELAMLVTYRPEDLTAGSLLPRLAERRGVDDARLRVALAPLDLDETSGLVSTMLADQRVSAEFAGFVQHHTEGLPLAIEELVRLMSERDDLVLRHGEWLRRDIAEIDVPPTIRDAVLLRADRLPPAARAVLHAAAVFGEPVDTDNLAAVSGLDDDATADGLRRALGARMLTEDSAGLVSFRHLLMARAVYEAIPTGQRRLLHRRAGAALEATEPAPVAQLARHFRAAGDVARWRAYAVRAVELATAAGDEAGAALQVGELLRDAGLDMRRATEMLDALSYATLSGSAHRLDDLASVLRATADAGGLEPADEGAARFQLGRLLRLRDQHDASRAEMERAVPLLAGNPEHAARAMISLGWPYADTAPAADHVRWLRRSEALAERLEPRTRQLLLVERIPALLLLGEPAGWTESERLWSDGVRATSDPQLSALNLLNTGDMAMMWGRYAEARRRLDASSALADAHGFARYRVFLDMTRAHLDYYTGNWSGLAERVDAIVSGGELPRRTEAGVLVGLLRAAQGSRDEARSWLERMLAARLRCGEIAYAMEPAAALARIHLAEGRGADALAVTDDPMAALIGKGVWLWGAEIVPERTAALVAAGRLDDAAELVDACRAGLHGRDLPVARAGRLLAAAMLTEGRGDPARAAQEYAAAAAAWRRLPRPYDALLATEREAGCLLAAGGEQPGDQRHGDEQPGDQARGVELLREVLRGLSELGARADAARVMATLRRHGAEARQPWAGRPSYGDRLSPREHEVVRLLVGGRTNREIAELLFLSPKTVGRHVESAMRKLGVPSRTALAVRVVETGLAPESGHAAP